MAATDSQNAARLEEAKAAAAARAGKTTAERLAEMKAEREKKLAAEAEARAAKKASTPSGQSATEIASNKKFAEQMLQNNPDTGAGGIIGSTIAKWAIDPKTGKNRTPQEIIDAVTEAVLADKNYGGVSLDPSTGKPQSWTAAQKVNQVLMQLMQNAKYEGQRYQPANEVYEYLKKGARANTVKTLANKSESWTLGKDTVGTIIDRQNFGDAYSMKRFVVDPTTNQLTPEQFKAYNAAIASGEKVTAIDPVTGGEVRLDLQGRYTLGEQPTGDVTGMDYSQYTPEYDSLNYSPLDIFDTGKGTGARNMSGGVGGSSSSGSGGSSDISDTTKDAFAALEDLFRSYGLDSLSGEIKGYMSSGLTAAEALIKLKTNPSGAYAERFAGNFARQKKGLNMMSEAAYIELENSYAETLRSYGLGSMLSVDSKTNWKLFSTWMANDINAPEFKDRISTVEDRVVNADPMIKDTFKKWFPSLTDQDLIAYFLSPSDTIGKLKEKVTAAEIGAAFLGQGLSTDVTSATDLARYGIDRAGALQGAADIKSVLPTSEKLSNIYNEAGIDYTQKSGEEEFLKSNQKAAEDRKRLKSLERAQYMGDSGVNSQYGSLAKNTQGAF